MRKASGFPHVACFLFCSSRSFRSLHSPCQGAPLSRLSKARAFKVAVARTLERAGKERFHRGSSWRILLLPSTAPFFPSVLSACCRRILKVPMGQLQPSFPFFGHAAESSLPFLFEFYPFFLERTPADQRNSPRAHLAPVVFDFLERVLPFPPPPTFPLCGCALRGRAVVGDTRTP